MTAADVLALVERLRKPRHVTMVQTCKEAAILIEALLAARDAAEKARDEAEGCRWITTSASGAFEIQRLEQALAAALAANREGTPCQVCPGTLYATCSTCHQKYAAKERDMPDDLIDRLTALRATVEDPRYPNRYEPLPDLAPAIDAVLAALAAKERGDE